jgi:tetratricopeptide (TPR) repeat protein
MTWPANTDTDRAKPNSTVAANNLIFLISNSFHSDVVARRLIHLADAAYFNRRYEELEHVSEALNCITRYESIAAYYQGIVLQSQQRHNSADELFRYALDAAPSEYQSRALVSLGASDVLQGKLTPLHYAQALRRPNTSLPTRVISSLSVAQVYAFSGEHHRAIKQIEALYPIARRLAGLNPRVYYDLLNSLAVEYSKVGSIEAAQRAILIVRQSLLFNSIAEYRETASDIEERSGRPASIAVSIPPRTRKVIQAMCLLFLGQKRADARPKELPRRDRAKSLTSRIVACTPSNGPPSFQ